MGKNGQKLLVICGPTGVGKTDLALHLARVLNGELISSDSRQVYKYMNIGTGKDLNKTGMIYGYDIVLPSGEFSVSQYAIYAKEKIKEIISHNKLPILVGGTGLYIKSIVSGIDTINIPKSKKLRESLSNKSASSLFNLLAGLDPIKAASMNQSDAKNPRRLIRAIEITNSKVGKEKSNPNFDSLWIGLKLNKEKLDEKILERVDKRIEDGFEQEIEFLKKNNYWKGAPEVTFGYKDWPDIGKWKREEIKYAKRQMLWFSKEKCINWFDIDKIDWQKNVEKLVKKWYSSTDAKEN